MRTGRASRAARRRVQRPVRRIGDACTRRGARSSASTSVDIGPDLRLLYHDGLARLGHLSVGRRAASLGRFGFDTDPRSLAVRGGRNVTGQRADHRRRRRPRDPGVALLRRRPHRRRRAQPRHPLARHRQVRRLRRPPRRQPERQLRQGRRPVVPGSQRRHVRPGLVPRARQLRGHERGHRRGLRALRELPVHERDDQGQPRAPRRETESSPRSSASSTTRASRTAPPATWRRPATRSASSGSTTRRATSSSRTSPRRGGRIAVHHPREARRRSRRPRSTASSPPSARMPGGTLRYAPGHPVRGELGERHRHAAGKPSSTVGTTPTPTTSGRSPTTGRSSGTSPRSAT